MRSGRSRQLYLSDWRNETRYHWVRNERLRCSDKLYEKIRSAGKRISFIYVLSQSFSVWTAWMSKEWIRKKTTSRRRPPQRWQGPRLLLRRRAFWQNGEEKNQNPRMEQENLASWQCHWIVFLQQMESVLVKDFPPYFLERKTKKNFREKKLGIPWNRKIWYIYVEILRHWIVFLKMRGNVPNIFSHKF